MKQPRVMHKVETEKGQIGNIGINVRMYQTDMFWTEIYQNASNDLSNCPQGVYQEVLSLEKVFLDTLSECIKMYYFLRMYF